MESEKEKQLELARAFELFIEVATLCKTRLEDVLCENNLNYNEWRILNFLSGGKIDFWTTTGQTLFITPDDISEEAKNLEAKGLVSTEKGILTAEGKVMYWTVVEQFRKLAKSIFEFQEEMQRQYFMKALNTIKQLII